MLACVLMLKVFFVFVQELGFCVHVKHSHKVYTCIYM